MNIKKLDIRKIKKLISLIVILSTSILLYGCNNPSSANIVEISVPEIICDVNEFELNEYKLHLHYDNYLVEKIPLDDSMISTSDLEKLNTIGTHTITITYNEFTTVVKITIYDSVKQENSKLTIFQMNDVHGYIEQNEYGKGGLSNSSYIINAQRNETKEDDTLLIANGDMFQGTAISNITEGRSVIDAMNEMDFDVMGIGNHEFDWGLDKILRYFDNNSSNGEANFPLINSNIYYRNSTKLVSIENGKIFDSVIIQKEDIKIGIISFIDDLEGSINATMYAPYQIKMDIEYQATKLCNALKNQGADIIIANVHGGNSSGVEYFNLNTILAKVRAGSEYAIDAIINGHTHTRQKGYITRTGGVSVPVVQSSGNNGSIGKIELSLNKEKDVIDSEITNINVNNTEYNNNVEQIIDRYTEEVGTQPFCIAGETVSNESVLGKWAMAVMKQAMNVDVAIMNTGGIRSEGNIVKGNPVSINNAYEISPFNNLIYICEVKGSNLYRILRSSSYYYQSSLNYSTLQNDNTYYKVAVIDYVYTGGYFPDNINAILTPYGLTDLMIEEMKLHDVFYPSDLNDILIGKKYE